MRKHQGTLSLHRWGKSPAELFEQALRQDRNAWSIDQARAGLRNSGSSISKGEADRRLKAALALLENGGTRG